MEEARARPHIPELTSLRFFAALLVVLFHMGKLPPIARVGTLRAMAGIGYTGVTFFFVLSGFILVYTYAGREIKVANFLFARFARIYPAYAFSLLFIAPFFFSTVKIHLSSLLFVCALVLTLLQAWFPVTVFAWNTVGWSLSAEAFFYVIFAPLLRFVETASRASLWLWMAGCWTASVCYSLVSLRISYNPLIRLPDFLIGMTCGALFLRTRNGLSALLLIAAGLLGIILIARFQAQIPLALVHNALTTPFYAAIIYGFALQPDWAIFLRSAVIVLLGEASYALYLLHVTILNLFPRSEWALAVVVAMGVSIAVYLLIEKPARRWLMAMWRAKAEKNKQIKRASPYYDGLAPSPRL